MATSVESLVNQALRRASYKIEIGSIYEGTTAARAALTLYGQTRDDLIRMKDWDFARQDATLVLLKTAPVGGEDGLKIYTRSARDTKNEDGDFYNSYMVCVEKACEEKGVSFCDCMKDFRSRKTRKVPTPVQPDADDQLAIHAAMAAFAAEDAV